MSDYKVQLEIFEGPLDLLLYLIKKEEVDIYRIPISKITTQYMEYLELLKTIVPDVAGEFVVMGATLMYIKSKMLLPEDQQVVDPDAPADELDPRWDLIRQLIEYKKFKDAAEHLHDREAFQESIYPRQQKLADMGFTETNALPANGAGIFDLLNAFNRVLKRANAEEDLRDIFDDRFTVSDKIDFILRITAVEEKTSFTRLFEQTASRTEIIVTFLALLELIRLKQLIVVQSESFGDIDLVRIKQETAAPAPNPAEQPTTDTTSNPPQ